MVEITLPNNWEPRPYQQNLWKYLIGGGKRAVAIWHRRAGKDDLALHFTACAAMRRVGNYWHMLPESQQCRRAIWQAINPETGLRRIYEAFPKGIIAKTLENEMFIEFVNGSTWSLVGSDNYQSLIGSPPVGLVFSEWSTSNANSFIYLEPIINQNSGWALFITTPRGTDNHASRMYESSRDKDEWFAEVLSAHETGVFTEQQLEDARQTYIDIHGEDVGDAYFRQEYLCSFTAALVGAYFGREMEALEQKGQIGHVAHDAALPTHTAWDIGSRDATSIICFQLVKKDIHIIDYIENSGVGADWYARELKAKPYTYGQHVMPHDVVNEEWGVGRTRVQTLRALGINPRVLPPQKSVQDGINAVRQILPSVWIDRGNCKRLITALKQYHRTWDDIRKCYSDKPYHDWSSNPADAMRYLAVSNVRNVVKRDLPKSRMAIV